MFLISRYLVFLLLATLSYENAYPCASCGAGGLDAGLILYPNENSKIGFQISQQDSLRNIDSSGSYTVSGGADKRQSYQLSGALALGLRSFIFTSANIVRNRYQNLEAQVWGDPSLGGRYTLSMLDFTEPAIPQIQIISAYKHRVAASVFDSDDPEYLLDVAGTGFSELRLGIDLWWGSWFVKPGLMMGASAPVSRNIDNRSYDPGLIYTSIVSLALNVPIPLKHTLSIIRERKEDLKVDGTTLYDSDSLTQSMSYSAEWMFDRVNYLRLGFMQRAPFLRTYNSFATNQITIGFSRAY